MITNVVVSLIFIDASYLFSKSRPFYISLRFIFTISSKVIANPNAKSRTLY